MLVDGSRSAFGPSVEEEAPVKLELPTRYPTAKDLKAMEGKSRIDNHDKDRKLVRILSVVALSLIAAICIFSFVAYWQNVPDAKEIFDDTFSVVKTCGLLLLGAIVGGKISQNT